MSKRHLTTLASSMLLELDLLERNAHLHVLSDKYFHKLSSCPFDVMRYKEYRDIYNELKGFIDTYELTADFDCFSTFCRQYKRIYKLALEYTELFEFLYEVNLYEKI